MTNKDKKEITSICSKWAVMLHQSMLQFNDVTDEQLDKMRNMVISFIDQLAAEEVGNYFTKKEVALLSRIVDGFLVMNDSYSEQQEAITIKGKLQKLQSGDIKSDGEQK